MPPFEPRCAFFLDLDGTLVDIADTPEAVDPGPAEIDLLKRLAAATGGALAVISGRSLARIDELLAPLVLPAAGQHGAERRDAKGKRHRHRFPAEVLQRAAVPVREFAARNEGLVFEDKGASVALHYRLAPELAAAAEAVVRAAAEAARGAAEVQVGKMVFELKPAGVDKGRAIEEFMQDAPFAGRVPVFLGDDVTDEFGFRVVNRIEGHSIKVGPGPTDARYRVGNPAGAKAWLGAWMDRFGRSKVTKIA
jgi:trehalose 6-phosphate phosphatase